MPYNCTSYLSHGQRASIYLAAPLTTYGTAAYEAALAGCRARWLEAEIISPRDAFADRAEWLTRWPTVLARCDRLVFIADADGVIGYGVWQEVHDAERRGLPVLYLDAAGRFIPRERVQLRKASERSHGDWRSYATVRVVDETAVT